MLKDGTRSGRGRERTRHVPPQVLAAVLGELVDFRLWDAALVVVVDVGEDFGSAERHVGLFL